MPASLQDIQRRIVSTKKTGQITSAMQMVSTAKLSQIQRHTLGYQAYTQQIKTVVSHLSKAHILADTKGDLVEVRPVIKTAILVISSDRGLVGSYNSSVLKQTMDLLTEKNLTKDNTEILAIGGVGADFFKKRGFNVAYEYRGITDVPEFIEVKEIVKAIIAMFTNNVFDEIFIAYNHYVNRISNEFKIIPMLPITEKNLSSQAQVNSNEQVTSASYEMDPSPAEILKAILPQYIEAMLYGTVLDAKTDRKSVV